jgi:hypothetical protein
MPGARGGRAGKWVGLRSISAEWIAVCAGMRHPSPPTNTARNDAREHIGRGSQDWASLMTCSLQVSADLPGGPWSPFPQRSLDGAGEGDSEFVDHPTTIPEYLVSMLQGGVASDS